MTRHEIPNIRTEGEDILKSEIEQAKRGYKILVVFILFIVLILSVKHFLIENVTVSGKSMEPTFSTGDVVLAKKFDLSLERFDIVIVGGDEKNLIKRIIGMPNERIQISDGLVYINGALLDTDICSDLIQDGGCADEEVQLAEDEYFVLGDNRNASSDSRDFGAVKREQIDGKVIVRILPFSEITTDFERGANGGK